ncbi:MAG: polyprenyl diphosphate synthase, partial [Candidatus Omnitrophota bacterium]
IPVYLQESIKKAVEDTKNNTSLILNIALNYGSRSEIVDAVRKITEESLKSNIKPEDINETSFKNFLYTKDLPDPDLLIRTSGEMRVSNFLLWQISYTELYFSKKFWPDFDKKEFIKAIKDYQKRERRYGLVDAN